MNESPWQPELDGERAPASASPTQVEIRRSARRRRTVQARWQGETVVVLMPEGLPRSEEQRLVDSLVGKMVKQRSRHSSGRSDAWLERRAVTLASRHLDAAVGRPVRASGVRWVSNMQKRWGSCSVQSGQIRLSDALAIAPEHVVDAVLVHELAHLVHGNHSAEFRALEAHYPRLVEARAWLAGFSAGHRAASTSPGIDPGGLDDDTPEVSDE